MERVYVEGCSHDSLNFTYPLGAKGLNIYIFNKQHFSSLPLPQTVEWQGQDHSPQAEVREESGRWGMKRGDIG